MGCGDIDWDRSVKPRFELYALPPGFTMASATKFLWDFPQDRIGVDSGQSGL